MSEEEVGSHSGAQVELWLGVGGWRVVDDTADGEDGGDETEGNCVETDGEECGAMGDGGEEAGDVLEVGVVGGEAEEADDVVVDVADGGGGGGDDGESHQGSSLVAWWTGHPGDCNCLVFVLSWGSW